MANSINRRRCHPHNRRSKVLPSTNDPENLSAQSHDLFDKCEQLKQNLLSLANDQASIWLYRQELLDQYAQLILFDLDYALEKKIEHDLWTIVFKNEMNFQQEQLKVHYQHPSKRAEIQNSLQTVYEYARGYYLKLLQDVVHSYNFENSICKLSFPLVQKRHSSPSSVRQCKEASMLYFIQHILVHVGDLNRYSNQPDLAKVFYQYAIQTIPCLGQPYNQIAILHETKNAHSLLSPGQNQLITTYYYVRSIAIKVTFPLAIANLEKLFQRCKDIRYESPLNENDFLMLFLQLVAMIHLGTSPLQVDACLSLLRSSMMKNFNQTNFIQMITILMFTLHKTLGLVPKSSLKQPEQQFDWALGLLVMIVEQCLEAIQLPLSMMIIDEQHILPVLYLCFAYLATIQKLKSDLFEHRAFHGKATLWNSLAKLLRSFSVYAISLDTTKDKNDATDSLLIKYSDYPLVEERTLECFTPLNDMFKVYNYKKYSEPLSEKDERQLRKLRLVAIVRTLCQKIDEKTRKKALEHLVTYVKDDIVCFESSSPVKQQIPSSNFGVPGDRRATGANVKIPRGARNVALRQYLEPALAGSDLGLGSPSNEPSPFSMSPVTRLTHHESDPWPRLASLTESRDPLQQRPIDDESVWSHDEAAPHPLHSPGSMFSNPSK